MIKYALRCEHGHGFEGWFRNSGDYDAQAEGGLLSCPVCGSSEVEKQVMAPAVARSGALSKSASKAERLDAFKRDFNDAARKARDYVRKNFDNVGQRFPEEARRIHYGETADRPIYGEATAVEAKELADEGVTVAPVPQPLDEAPVPKKKLS
ncbi:MAG: DUF1178 family protein [Pseudomonadota bacterium]